MNATFAVSNHQLTVSENMNRGSVRGLVFKSTPSQPKDSTEEMDWNDNSHPGPGAVTEREPAEEP